ncbi:MAG: acetyl-CoA carboxylase carboxyltransferase subunit alpha [Lachnospiraceae bacterium]|nr:acetyl-CoA carboxylase carboxyltransferase subunit alpha [Lachnospiraceae bacterium]
MLRDMFKKTPRWAASSAQELVPSPEIPTGMWRKCNKCSAPIYTDDVINNQYICPKCGGYFRVHARRRVEITADENSFEEWDDSLCGKNPLNFPGYEEKLSRMHAKTNLEEAVITGKARIDGYETVLGIMDARFLMGSMGQAVGEKITRAFERATKEKLPVILFCCSGGARMQEGIVSLMQMAKTSAAIKKHSEAGLLYVTVLTDPTTGGVTASFAMLGDVILAEPGALIGFAGPRVIEQTIGQKLPDGFQRAEFLQEHGFVDKVVPRKEMRSTLAAILALHAGTAPHKGSETEEAKEREAILELAEEEIRMQGRREAYSDLSSAKKAKNLSPWERVQISRKSSRPTGLDYIEGLFVDFIEFHGDRFYKDDKAIVGGIAWFGGRPVTVIAQQKGRSTKDNIFRNFGMPSPDGYRKALRLMKQAEKFGRPIICFVDTPGAFCGMEAEERGQGEAIARNLLEMSALKVPVLSIVIGEGGSGGALAMAVGNEVWMLENSIYSILSPEGFASILWKDSKRANEAAKVMRITAAELKELGIIDRIISEAEEAGKETLPDICDEMRKQILKFMKRYTAMSGEELAEQRYMRFRNM